MSGSKNIEYGNFDILWKGALKALLDEDNSENVHAHPVSPWLVSCLCVHECFICD